jgi:hypothetical protein
MSLSQLERVTTNHVIAQRIGCSHHLIRVLREELEATGAIDRFVATGGRGIRDGAMGAPPKGRNRRYARIANAHDRRRDALHFT